MESVKKTLLLILWLILCQLPVTMQAAAVDSEKIVIAHRGASGYLPEHTLEAKVLAHAQGADYIEQDVVMSRDDALVVLHDLTLNRVTDVADKFPGRARPDGGFYVIDFILDELRQLRVTEPVVRSKGTVRPVYRDRFPAGQSYFSIHTLGEEIELIQGLNKTSGREAGIYVEVKSPWFHHQAGKDASEAILRELKHYGYDSKEDRIYLQTFDFNELKRIHDELLPALGMDLKLVQLIAWNDWRETMTTNEEGELVPYDYDWMRTEDGMKEIARYADGVGPSMDMIVEDGSRPGDIHFTSLVRRAHAAGLQVHPFTFRKDRLPAYAADFEQLLDIFLFQADADGVFTDFPDLAVGFLNNRKSVPASGAP